MITSVRDVQLGVTSVQMRHVQCLTLMGNRMYVITYVIRTYVDWGNRYSISSYKLNVMPSVLWNQIKCSIIYRHPVEYQFHNNVGKTRIALNFVIKKSLGAFKS